MTPAAEIASIAPTGLIVVALIGWGLIVTGAVILTAERRIRGVLIVTIGVLLLGMFDIDGWPAGADSTIRADTHVLTQTGRD